MRQRASNQRGSALIVTLALFAIALGLTTIVTARAISAAQGLVRRERQVLALNAGEAGLAEVAQGLRIDPWMAAADGEIGPSQWSAKVTHDLSSVDFHVAVVIVDATTMDQARRIRARLLVTPSASIDIPASVSLLSWELLSAPSDE